MNLIHRMLTVAGILLLLSSNGFAQDGVPLPCDPAVDCKPVDPCELAPERCKDKGGPIEQPGDDE